MSAYDAQRAGNAYMVYGIPYYITNISSTYYIFCNICTTLLHDIYTTEPGTTILRDFGFQLLHTTITRVHAINLLLMMPLLKTYVVYRTIMDYSTYVLL